MTPEHLKKLNRLQSNVHEIEKALAGLRDGGQRLWAEDYVSAEVSQSARKILEDDLLRQLAEAKALFAAADAPPKQPDPHNEYAVYIKFLRDLADNLESKNAYLRSMTRCVERTDFGHSVRIEWYENLARRAA